MSGSVWLLAPLAGLAGAALAGAVGEPARPWFVSSVAIVTALEVYVARSALERTEPGTYLRWRRTELVLLAVGMRIAQAITGAAGGVTDPTWGNRETVISLFVLVAIRSAVNATIDDLDAIDRALHRSDGTDPVDRIRGRVIGYLVVVALASGFAAVGIAGLFDLTRGTERRMPWTPVIFLGLALPGLAFAVFKAKLGKWQRDGAAIDGAVATAWFKRSAAIGSIVVLVAVLAWNAAGASGIAAAGIVRSGPVGEWIVERLGGIGDLESDAATDRGEGQVVDPASQLDTDRTSPPEWLGEAMLWMVAATVFWWAASRGRRASLARRERAGGRASTSLKDVLVEIWRMLGDLLRGLWRIVRGAKRVATGAGSSRVRSAWAASSPWSSDDLVRARIARSYRRAGEWVARRSGLRRRSETPREFAFRVAGDQPNQAHDVSNLTSAYEEARFSVHQLTEDRAVDAELAADRVETRSRERQSDR